MSFSLPVSVAGVPAPRRDFARSLLALLLSFVALLIGYCVLSRACEGGDAVIWRYVGYIVLFVWLPGWLVLRACLTRRISFVESVALGLPVGFAVEVLVYLGLASLGAREAYAWTPLFWLSGAAYRWWHRSEWSGPAMVWEAARRNAGIVCCLSVLLLGAIFTTAGHFYAAAPLVGGRLMDGTHCDWVYLISRAAEIKTHWPLQDPSMAGQPLSYHYFLMVHLAASSDVTGASLSLVLLRLFVLPLHVALLLQSFWLGRRVSRAMWGGVVAALLVLLADEVSFNAAGGPGTFGDFFTRWLYISPTFFFGLIFAGVLLILVHELATSDRFNASKILLLGLLGAAATGAKATVVPPLLAALGIWTAIECVRTKTMPRKMLTMCLVLGAGFAAVYISVLSEWGSGAAKIAPFASMRLSEFWVNHVDRWLNALMVAGLPWELARALAWCGCACIILLGHCGVRILAVPYFFMRARQHEPSLVLWLGLTGTAGFGAGQFLQLDSDGQLYFLFPTRITASVLAAGAIAAFWPHGVRLYERLGERRQVFRVAVIAAFSGGVLLICAWRGELAWWLAAGLFCASLMLGGKRQKEAAMQSRNTTNTPEFWRGVIRLSPYVAALAVLLIQMNHLRMRNQQGFSLWLINSLKPGEANLAPLRDGLRWIRDNTPGDAVVIANAFTPAHLRPDHLAQIDGTTVDKYFYYSAFCERRCWVEGPSYLRDQAEAERRMRISARLFYEADANGVLAAMPGEAVYVLVDRALNDGAQITLPDSRPLFRNERVSIFRLQPAQELGMTQPSGGSTRAGGLGDAMHASASAAREL